MLQLVRSIGSISFLLISMMYLSLGKKSTKEFTVKHSFLNLSDKPEQFHKLLSSEEIVVLLVQSKYGSNSNVSVGYKIEAGIKSLSKKSSNVFKFAKVQSEDILQDPTRKNSKVRDWSTASSPFVPQPVFSENSSRVKRFKKLLFTFSLLSSIATEL